MKTKILSVCVIAGLFAGCSQLNLPKPPQIKKKELTTEEALRECRRAERKYGVNSWQYLDEETLRKCGRTIEIENSADILEQKMKEYAD